MFVADEASRRAMEVVDKSKKEGIVMMPTVVPDPPESGEVEVAPETARKTCWEWTRSPVRKR